MIKREGVLLLMIVSVFLASSVSAIESNFGYNIKDPALSFLQLEDTPSSFSGGAGLCLKVNGTEDVVIFEACNSTGSVNNSEFAEKWITNEGILDNVIDILGSWINNNLGWLNQTDTDNIYLNLSGTNTNQNLDISPYNLTLGRLLNFSGNNPTIRLSANGSRNAFSDGSSLELYSLAGEAKPYIAWYNSSNTGVGWLGCHYNLSNGNVHEHCSFETVMDDGMNSRFEIGYGGAVASNFIRVSSVGDFILGSGVDLQLTGASSDIESSDPIDLYPSGGSSMALRIDNTTNNVVLQALGSDWIKFNDGINATGKDIYARHLFVTNISSDEGLFTIGNITANYGFFDYVGINQPSPLHNLDIIGDILLTHTAAGTDEHALEVKVDAAGFGDVKGIDIIYDTGAIASGDVEEVILVNIDEFEATGGDVIGLGVISTEGSANIYALEAGALVAPIVHLSGTFGNMDSADNNGVDNLAEFISTASDVTIFANDNDYVTIGDANKFEEIEFILDTEASVNIKPTFEYSTGVGTWGTFSPSDGTNGFENNGVIVWLDEDIPSWATGTGGEYLIRITRTKNNVVTVPVEDKVQISAITKYYWDKNADLYINNLTGTNIGLTGNLTADWGNFNAINTTDGYFENLTVWDRVGVRTATPSSSLDVAGNMNISNNGNLTIGSWKIWGTSSGSLRFGGA